MSSRLRLTAVAAATLATLTVPGTALASSGDRDRDGMPDKYERANGLDPRKNDARGDKDKDGLRNLVEFRGGTNPSKADSDGDGIRDGDDKRPKVKDDARVRFRVTSYDATTGALVVAYGKGSSLTVTVTADTELEWRGHRKGCTSVATVANLVSGAGIDKLKLARPSSDDDHHSGNAEKPDDSGHHARVATRSDDTPSTDDDTLPGSGDTLPGGGDTPPGSDAGPVADTGNPVAERIGLVCAAGS
ncbi:hypothetical protein Aab01nite_34440 [Paractinoplanes abujensis]|uniref:Uncharacterized protein n=1 Tax=Paractinoplanes abujensis TaxID=882441 RepID=A0A7W7G648_9ACTN|nr:hypothetical protein [Actinoplanes abujensis]MBB4697657.1 hypothetical protein [Actinoplanes abujensis]GID19854.1 hypothetical protein Aab01nite_34440 [Actinoplanes abujensis]